MKRVILSLPAGTTLDTLTVPQRLAIESIAAQWAQPMPGTIEHAGRILVDGVMADAFDPAVMPSLGLDWPVVGLWQWDAVSPAVVEVLPLDGATLLAHLPPRHEFDEEGAITLTLPPVLHEPHRWGGWPPCF